MTNAPLVTIGLPVYNSERHLEQSLKSLLAQTYRDFVLVISDNASTDGTAAICRKYAEADSRIKYFRNDVNIGNPRNFNRVYSLVSTKYLKWSTADDFWAPEFVESALEVMENDPTIALCYPQAYLVDAEGRNAKPYDDVLHLMQDDPAERFELLLERIKLAHQHLGLMRMSCLQQTRLLGTHVGSDINLLAELALYGKFYELPKRYFHRRFHEKSGSWKRGDTKHEMATYHQSGAKRTGLRKWRTHLRLFSSVARAPLPMRSKSHLYGRLLRRMRWDGADLFRELLPYTRPAAR